MTTVLLIGFILGLLLMSDRLSVVITTTIGHNGDRKHSRRGDPSDGVGRPHREHRELGAPRKTEPVRDETRIKRD